MSENLEDLDASALVIRQSSPTPVNKIGDWSLVGCFTWVPRCGVSEDIHNQLLSIVIYRPLEHFLRPRFRPVITWHSRLVSRSVILSTIFSPESSSLSEYYAIPIHCRPWSWSLNFAENVVRIALPLNIYWWSRILFPFRLRFHDPDTQRTL